MTMEELEREIRDANLEKLRRELALCEQEAQVLGNKDLVLLPLLRRMFDEIDRLDTELTEMKSRIGYTEATLYPDGR